MAELKDFQKNVCELPEPIPPAKKICPTCEPDETYVEPTWWETDKPYLHKGLCEYRVSVTSKEDPRGLSTNGIKAQGYKSLRDGLVKILREYDKLQTNQILCAYPPDSTNDNGCPVYVPPEVYLKLTDIELFKLKLPKQENYQDRYNPLSLEVVAKVEDYHLGEGLETFKVLISIPADAIDRLEGDAVSDEEAEEIEEDVLTTESVEFKGRELGGRTRKLSSTFRLYSKYQQVGFVTNKISLLQENSEGEEVKFRIIKFVKRDYFKQFRQGLRALLKQNNFRLRSINSPKTAHKIKIVFDKTDNNKPYEIKAIYAAKKGCPYEKLRKISSLKALPAFKDQTFMHYMANLEKLTDELDEGADTPWLDFIVDNTYPPLAVDFGDIDNGEDASDTCIDIEVLDNLKDNLLGELMSFAEVLEFAFSSAGCSDLEDTIPVNEHKIQFKSRQARKLGRARRKTERKAEQAAEKAKKEAIKKLKEEKKPKIEAFEKENEEHKKNIRELEKQLNDNSLDANAKTKIINDIFFKENLISLNNRELNIIESSWEDEKQTTKKSLKNDSWILEKEQRSIERKIDVVKFEQKGYEKAAKEIIDNIPLDASETERQQSLDSADSQYDLALEKEKEIIKLKQKLNEIKNKLKEIRYNRRDMNGIGKTFNLTSDKVKAALEDALKDFNPFQLIDDIKDVLGNREDRGEFKLRNILSILNPCKWNLVAFDIISCLLGGLSLQEAIPIIVKKTLQNSSPLVLEKLFIGLSPEKQQEVSQKVRKKLEEAGVDALDAIATPWEEARKKAVEENKITNSGKRKQIVDNMEFEQAEMEDSESMQELKKTREQNKNNIRGAEQQLETKQRLLTEKINEKQKLADEFEEKRDNLSDLEKVGYEQSLRLRDEEIAALELEVGNAESDLSSSKQTLEITKNQIDEKRQDENNSSTAIADIAVIVFQAYIEALVESLAIDDLTAFIDRIPGAKIFKKIFLTITCPTANSFKFNLLDKLPDLLRIEFCKDGGNGWALPRLPRLPDLIIPDIRWILKQLIEILKEELINLIAELLIALIIKILELLQASLCNSIAALGKFIADAVQGEASLSGLLDAVSDAFCNNPDNASNTMDNLLGKGGIPSSKRPDIAAAISQAVSKNDIKKAFLNDNNQDPRAMKAMYAAIVGNGGFEGVIESPEDVSDLFGIMSSYLSPEQKLALANSIDDEGEFPVDQSICLTNSQKEEWDKLREDFWFNKGLDRDAAKDYVKKLNNEATDNLGNFMDLFNKGPEGILADALDKALKPPKDPDCVDAGFGSTTSIIPTTPDSIKDMFSELSEGMFKTLFFAFTRDMIGSRNSYFDNILADRRGIRLSSGFFNHQRRVDYNLLFANAANTDEQHAEKLENANGLTNLFMRGFRGVLFNTIPDPTHTFPSTVSIYMKDQLDANIGEEGIEYSEGKMELTYENVNYGFEGEGPEIDSETGEVTNAEVAAGDADFKFNLKFYNSIPGKEKEHLDLYRIEKIDRNASGEGKFAKTVDFKLNISHGIREITKVNNFNIPENLSRSYVEQVFVEQIKSTFSQTSATFKDDKIAKMYDIINKSIINHLAKDLTDVEKFNPFDFGYEGDEIGYEDLLYVDKKGADEYTHEEEEGILGTSKTGNPRVKFLDPAVHGGRYTRPKVYIEPAEHSGLFRKLQMVVPEFDGCEPARSDFLNLKEISDKVSKLQSSLPMDERMSQEPDCRIEPPFDKIHTSNGLAYLEGIIKATTRTYVVEFILRSIPFVSIIKFNDFNYDNAILEMIVDKMQEGIQDIFMPFSMIREYNYWLLFVEESVTATFRQVSSKEIKPSVELQETLNNLIQISNSYYNPTKLDRKYIKRIEDIVIDSDGEVVDLVFSNSTPSANKKAQIINMVNALCLYGYGRYWKRRVKEAVENGKKPKKLRFVSLRKLKTATRMFEVHKNIDEAKKVLKYHVNNELKAYSDILDESMSPQSDIYDINKYLIGASKFFHLSNIEAGLAEIESPTGDSTSIQYGEIPDCPKDNYSIVDESGIDSDENGAFHIEKFVYVTPKEQTFSPPVGGTGIGIGIVPNLQTESKISELISNSLPEGGVMSIQEFKELFNQLSDQEKDLKISEALGNAIFETDDEGNPIGILGTIGIQFGVRICYTPPASSSDFFSGVTQAEAKKFKSYNGQKKTFPIATFKQDIIDKKLSEINIDDDNLGEDLKCYVDQLCLTEDYRLLFRHLFITRKMVSMLLMYSYDAFIESVGLSEDEREPDELGSKGRWKSRILKNTKKQLRNLFAGFYREMEDPDEKEERPTRGIGLDFLKSFSPLGLINLNASVKWWQLRRLIDRPYDKDGNDCDEGIF